VSDQLRTYSECTRDPSPDTSAEVLERLALNDIVEHKADKYADEARAADPSKRIYTYFVCRNITLGWVAEWTAYATQNGINPAVGHIHHGGQPRILPSGWYVMNMGSPEYRLWCNITMVKQLKGLRYAPPPMFTYPPPLDGILIDRTMHYAAFDVSPNEMINTSDEYAGNVAGYIAQLVPAFIESRDYVAAALPGVKVYPNFGNILYAGFTDANTLALIAASEVILVEESIRYRNGEPATDGGVLSAETCIQRWDLMAMLVQNDRELMLDGHLESPQDTASRDLAKRAIAAFFLIGQQPRMFCRYFIAPEDDPDPIETWEQNDFIRIATAALGSPSGPRTQLPSTTGITFLRSFDNGVVAMHVRKSNQSGSETVMINLGQALCPLDLNGDVGAATREITLALGEAKILVRAATRIEAQGNDDSVPMRPTYATAKYDDSIPLGGSA